MVGISSWPQCVITIHRVYIQLYNHLTLSPLWVIEQQGLVFKDIFIFIKYGIHMYIDLNVQLRIHF